MAPLPGKTLQPAQPGVTSSEQYFPIIIDPQKFGRSRDALYGRLREKSIFARKYFHPICTDFEPYRNYPIHSTYNTPYVHQAKSQVLCLPFHSGVDDDDIDAIRAEFLHPQ
jgi:dTDP-4-amino-4,6-dideoxygalactose transaminase